MLPQETFVAPVIEWGYLAPVLILLGAACAGVLVEAFVPRTVRHGVELVLTMSAIAAAFGTLVYIVSVPGLPVGPLAMGAVRLDGPACFLWGGLLVFGLLAVLLFAEKRVNEGASSFVSAAGSIPGSRSESLARAAQLEHTELYPLTLFALSGMMLYLASNDLLLMFVALEVFSLPLYLMSGLARRRRLLSQESALKYFVLSAFSSAFFLFGVTLLYGYAGGFQLDQIAAAGPQGGIGSGFLITGMALLLVGLLFKIGVVPFHNWVPDVYMGAPTPVTGFMAICTKIAAVGATIRILFVSFGALVAVWAPLLIALAVVTMVVGVIVALVQTDMKRMLAYSSIAHAGFLLTAIAGAVTAGPPMVNTISSVMFYLVAYGFATIGGFAIVTMVRSEAGEANTIEAWAGIGKKNPFVAAMFAFFLLSLAGIPLTAGFVGKWAVFTVAWRGGLWWLVLVAMACSLVAAVFYLRVVIVMFFRDSGAGIVVAKASLFTWIPMLASGFFTLLLGVAPETILNLAITLSTSLG